MLCLKDLIDLKKDLQTENGYLSINNIIKSINNYINDNYSENDLNNSDILYECNIKLDNVFNDNDLNNFLKCKLKYKNYYFNLIHYNCFKLPKKDIIKLFENCFKNEYIDSYNIDYQYNCIHIDKIIDFEKLIEINNYFSKYNILISYDFPKKYNKHNNGYIFLNEIIITFENCSISENFSRKYIDFYFSLLPNKYIRCY